MIEKDYSFAVTQAEQIREEKGGKIIKRIFEPSWEDYSYCPWFFGLYKRSKTPVFFEGNVAHAIQQYRDAVVLFLRFSDETNKAFFVAWQAQGD